MKNFPLIATAALALTLSACSGGNEAPEPAATSEAADASAVAENTIPEALRGRWGLTEADCTSDQGDAKGLLVVDAEKLEFYESVAQLGMIKARDDNMISASFEFSGEGDEWIMAVALSTTDGGKTLVRQDTGPNAAPDALTYTKCP